jgi:hypothetical protein
MKRLLALVLLVSGCAPASTRVDPPAQMFAPVSMRIHPVFTKVTDWNSDDRADGIEVVAEFQDEFGDTTKASGSFSLELFSVSPQSPDLRGRRISDPWLVDIRSADQQRQRWSRTARAYSFRLQAEKLSVTDRYVLTASFAPESGGRLFDRLVLGTK